MESREEDYGVRGFSKFLQMPFFGRETSKNLVFFAKCPFCLCCSKYWHFLQIPHLPLLQVVQNIDIFCKCFFWLSCNLRWGLITPGYGRFSPNTRTAGCLQFVAFLCKSCVINEEVFLCLLDILYFFPGREQSSWLLCLTVKRRTSIRWGKIFPFLILSIHIVLQRQTCSLFLLGTSRHPDWRIFANF